MDNIFRGELVSKELFLSQIDSLQIITTKDLLLPHLSHTIVIDALSKLAAQIDKDSLEEKLENMNLPKWAISNFIHQALHTLTKKEMKLKVSRELGEHPFKWRNVGNHFEKEFPLGVVMHIGAGNALGLSAMSVLEGLLTGNINILKLPSEENGISTELLHMLIKIEPRLKPYIYVVDVSSTDTEIISKIIKVVDAVAVWGGDQAIDALRKLTPPTVKLIEWGHRLSISYFDGVNLEDIKGLAFEIVSTDQLYCSSPQVVFVETESTEVLHQFGEVLLSELAFLDKKYPSAQKSINIESQITWERELIRAEEIYGNKLFIDDTKNYSVLLSLSPSLKPAPLFRNIRLMPIQKDQLIEILRTGKGHLQTVGLSVQNKEDYENIFYSAGINRIKQPRNMTPVYSGEPHDGEHALRRYVRIVNK